MKPVEDDPCLCAVTYPDGEYKRENVEMMVLKTTVPRLFDVTKKPFLVTGSYTAVPQHLQSC